MLRALGLRKTESTASLASVAGVGSEDEDHSSLVLQEYHDFELTLQAMDYVLDDQASKAIKMLNDAIKSQGRKAIFMLGLGVTEFIEATLGFEQDTIARARATLSEAETLSTKQRQLHERLGLKTSDIYPSGTVYAVTSAESNLLSALLMLFSESYLDSVKAFYRLRKAYHTLDEINKSITINRHRHKVKLQSQQETSLSRVGSASTPNLNESTSTLVSDFSSLSVNQNQIDYFKNVPVKLSSKQKKDIKLLNMAEKIYQLKKSRIIGSNIGNTPAYERRRSELGFKHNKDGIEPFEPNNEDSEEEDFVDAEEETSNAPSNIPLDLATKIDNSTIDEFIHSGTNLCFGILQVVLSLIPPAIGKVLSVVGFKGSRENGLKMVWNATKDRNIHGGIATLGLLVFYDGPFQFTDTDFDIPILENNKTDGEEISNIQAIQSRAFTQTGEATLLHPGKKLETVLLGNRAYFPNSALWLLQEGRMLASQGHLSEAVDLMDSANDKNHKKIEMQQTEALLFFDKAMILVYMHNYERAAEHFLKLIEMNSWSHGLYTYMAASCYVECYRMCKLGIYPNLKKTAEDFKKLAEKYLIKAPTYLEGVKKGVFQNKQMPMEKFFMRKISHLKKVKKENPKLDLIDCVGTSLAHEFSYFWNAYNRMDDINMELTLKLLGYSGAINTPYSLNTKEKNYSSIQETEQESMLRYLLQSLALRRLGRINEGMEIIDDYVIRNKILIIELTSSSPGNHDPIVINPQTKYIKRSEDPWLYPTALYERAIFCWKSKSLAGIEEVKEWLKKSIDYADDYELSARTGMRVKAALDRLEGY